MAKKKQTPVGLSDRSREMIEAIKGKSGYDTISAVITRAIEELYNNTFKYGADPLSQGLTTDTDKKLAQKAEVKAKTKLLEKEASEKIKLQPKVDICVNSLGGEVVEQENGTMVCKWQTHDVRGDYEQVIPLRQVGEYLVENQFIPDKETVKRMRPNLKVK